MAQVVILDDTKLHGEAGLLNIPVVGVVDTDQSHAEVPPPSPSRARSIVCMQRHTRGEVLTLPPRAKAT